MACHIFGAKPSSEPGLDYCWLDPCENFLVTIKSKYRYVLEIAILCTEFENCTFEITATKASELM